MAAAVSLLESSIQLAHATDISGAAWLIAEFGLALRPHAPEVVQGAVSRYAHHPEVLLDQLVGHRQRRRLDPHDRPAGVMAS